jgi:hypothetical protein
MKQPVTGIVLVSLTAVLVRVAGPPPGVRDLRLAMDSMTASSTPAAPACGLVAAVTTLETTLERQ